MATGRIWTAVGLSLALAAFSPQQSQDDQILERADKILEQSKAAYEAARQKNSVESFVDAGFKLEEARIKYFVLQEIGSPEKKKIAVDRLRAVNQLSRLIHDGKAAVGGKVVEAPAPAPAPAPDAPAPPPADPADPAPKAPPAAPTPPPVPAGDVFPRAPVPEAAKQKEAEKLLKELYKEQYAKKGANDRQILARALLDQARKSLEDPAALWVIYRDAQDFAAQTGDLKTLLTAVDETARYFDVDGPAMKHAALTVAAKSAKTAEDNTALLEALDPLIDELLAADQYEAAEKAASTAQQIARKLNLPRATARAAVRAKEVSEAKSRFAAMKSVLQTLAKTPDDPAANNEMGQFLCFVKGNWDLGLRFLVKGSDAGLKALAEKELALPTAVADQVVVADAWYALADKEKLPSRRNLLMSHAREIYGMALPAAVALQKSKIEKRIEAIDSAVGAPSGEGSLINLLKLVDLRKDVLGGVWVPKGAGIMATQSVFPRLQIPWQLPVEYDLMLTVERTEEDFLVLGLSADSINFAVYIDPGFCAAFEMLDGKDCRAQDEKTIFPKPAMPVGKPVVIKASIRRNSARIFLDGKLILNWEGGMNRLTLNREWVPPNLKCPFLGSHLGQFVFTAITLVPVQ